MGRYLNLFDWQLLFTPLTNCEEMWNSFSEVVCTGGIDILMPENEYRGCTADPPWMTRRLKSLILKRQKAFNTHGPDSVLFRHFRNVVNRERKVCRDRYYESKVQQLKGENPRRWWEELKRLSGAKMKCGDLISQINVNQFSDLSKLELPLDQYRLQEPFTRFPLEDEPEFLSVTEERVLKVLSKLHARKASGPDNVPNWLLKEYAEILASPIAQILNASYFEQRLPTIWKMADVPPLPKKKPVLDLKKDLRPVTLTPCVSKVAEEFVVEDFVKPAVLDVIGGSQYGEIPKSSTSMALISMMHAWALGTDGNGATVRTMLF